MQLSGATRDYVHAVNNPYEAKLCGIPTFPALPTYKARVFARGTAQTGTTGVGFVAASPGQCFANDTTSVYYTDSTFAGTAFAFTGTGINNAAVNSPYPASEIVTTAVTARVVGAGLRVRYGGTELNRGGFKICLVDPQHTTLGGRDAASLGAEPQTRRYPVNRTWTNLMYRPVNTAEISFQAGGALTSAYMGALLVAPAGVELLYEWEFFAIVEFQGATAVGQSHTNVDPTGYAAASSVINQTNSISTLPAHQSANQMLQATHRYIADGISGVHTLVNTGKQIKNTASQAMSIFEDVMDLSAPLLALI